MLRPRRSAGRSAASAAAAKQVSAKIGNVSRDGANSVDGRAKRGTRRHLNVSSNLSSLQAILVKVVRTSTEEADRRRWPRVESNLPIQVNCPRPDASRTQCWRIFPRGGAWIPRRARTANRGNRHHDGSGI